MFQTTIIAGNLGGDPVLRYTQGSVAVCDFSVATNESWTDAQGVKQTKVTWFKTTAWGKLAELCNQYLGKGRKVLVEGTVSVHPWIDAKGEPRATLELKAALVRFLDSAGNVEHTGVDEEAGNRPQRSPANQAARPPQQPPARRPAVEEEEIPF